MSTWGEELPTLAPPQYLDRKVHADSSTVLRFYSNGLGLTNTLRKVSPEKNLRVFSSKDIPAPFSDPPIVRSETWMSPDFIQSSKKRRWIQFKSKFISCMKSVQFRFTALGLLLGLILSLAAIIPIVVVWQASISKTTTAPSSSNSLVGSSLSVSTILGICDSYFCEERVMFITNMTTTALTLVITVQRNGNTTYHGDYNTYNTLINSTHTESATEITYTFFFTNGQLPAGNYTCAAQFHLNNVNQTTSSDNYSIKTTNVCGNVNSASGHF